MTRASVNADLGDDDGGATRGAGAAADERDGWDVVVVGGHLTTGLLAAVLAANGVRVVVVPSELDGVLPAGETTVPYTAELFVLLASRFGVAEIADLGMFGDLPEALRRSSAAKGNLGFVYHRVGARHDGRESLQFTVPSEHGETHFYRPDLDRYALELARSRGATLRSAVARPFGITVGDDGVSVELSDGTLVRAGYLVEGSGDSRLHPSGAARSPGRLAAPPRHRARLLWNHLARVRPFEQVVAPDQLGAPGAWSAGTLLHVFDGGWLQVVGLGTTDPDVGALSGVSLSLDPARWAAVPGPPANEFDAVIRRFPDLARQFEAAVPVGTWQRHDGWPVLDDELTGPRWLLFDRSAGRGDLLLSRELTTGLELVHAAAAGVLELARTGDWAGDGMRRIGNFERDLFRFQDDLAVAARSATADFPLLNAFLRVWLLWSILAALSVKRARMDGEQAGGSTRWSVVERFTRVPDWYDVPAGLTDLLRGVFDDVDQPLARPAAVAEKIFGRLRRAPFVPPLYDFADPAARFYDFDATRRDAMAMWVETMAPADFRRLLTDDNVTGVAVPRRAP